VTQEKYFLDFVVGKGGNSIADLSNTEKGKEGWREGGSSVRKIGIFEKGHVSSGTRNYSNDTKRRRGGNN